MAQDMADPEHVDRQDSEEEEEDEDELPEDFYKVMPTKSRGSVSAEAYGEWNAKAAFVPPVIPKTEEQQQRLRDCLSQSFMFANLDPQQLATVIDAMSEMSVEPQRRLIQQGDGGDCLYVVETGRFGCAIKNPEIGEEAYVKFCEAGDVFGELALLYNAPRAASVDSIEASVVWRLDRDTFNHIVKDAAQAKRARYEEFLANVPLLSSMSAYERSQLADALQTEACEDAQVIVTQGEIGRRFYIVEEGQATAWKDGEMVMTYTPGDYFGELALMRNQPRATTVMSNGPLKLLSCDSASFQRLLNVEKLEEMASKYT